MHACRSTLEDPTTAKYGFSAPLGCGARLGGADDSLVEAVERIGRHVGMAYQLNDDLIGLFGEERVTGKPADSDFLQGKRTFPLIAAYVRASAEGRAELEALWGAPEKGLAELTRARALVEEFGGRAATQRAVERATRSAQRGLAALPSAGGVREVLESLVTKLAGRRA